MGMFDYLHAEKLPLNDEMRLLDFDKKKSWQLQTKDFNNDMSNYVIKNKMLYVKEYKNCRWIVPEKDKSESPLDNLGHLEHDGEYLKKVKFTGEVFGYDYTRDVNDKWDCFSEWMFTFNNGVLKKVKLAEFTAEDNGPRKESLERWKRDQEIENAKWQNKYLFNTRPYRIVTKRIANVLIYIGHKFQDLAFAITR